MRPKRLLLLVVILIYADVFSTVSEKSEFSRFCYEVHSGLGVDKMLRVQNAILIFRNSCRNQHRKKCSSIHQAFIFYIRIELLGRFLCNLEIHLDLLFCKESLVPFGN